MPYHNPDHDLKPPSWALGLIRLLCHPDFGEQIEGDLLEKYQAEATRLGAAIARRRFYFEMLMLLRPSLIFNFAGLRMGPRSCFLLLLTVFVIVLVACAPFLPGPYIHATRRLSSFSQHLGFFGLLIVPIGTLWLLIELRNSSLQGRHLNGWTSGFYFSLLIFVPWLLLQTWSILLVVNDLGVIHGVAPTIITIVLLWFVIPQLRRLRHKSAYQFNPAPLYLILIPITALVTNQLALERIAEMTRGSAIAKTQPLIAAIEEYKTQYGEYPDLLNDVEGTFIPKIPQTNFLGMSGYRYEKRDEGYQLSFEQSHDFYVTEVAVYDKTTHKTPGAHQRFETGVKDWQYFWAD